MMSIYGLSLFNNNLQARLLSTYFLFKECFDYTQKVAYKYQFPLTIRSEL